MVYTPLFFLASKRLDSQWERVAVISQNIYVLYLMYILIKNMIR